MAPPPAVVLDAHAVSGITGSISILCWIIVFSPQLYENFRRKSAKGLSITFVVLWLLGDVFNVMGSILQKLLPTMIILAIYYTLADIILLAQALMYNASTNRVDPGHLNPATPLLQHLQADGIPTELDISNVEETIETVLSNTSNYGAVEDEADRSAKPSTTRMILSNSAIVLLVIVAGTLGWFISTAFSSGNDDSGGDDDGSDHLAMNFLGQVFGWLCAVLYLGSRVPQILLNYRRKSCDGIAFLFFLFACIGNLMYVISILVYDISPTYLLVNASWLVGSFGTLLLDFVIFVQFWIYGDDSSNDYDD
ncbi:hypothetical protein CANCADRAFT_14737, partial [Tortispora caseinolytica NRRL Y-17796]